MQIQVSHKDPTKAAEDALVILLAKGDKLPRALRPLDAALGGRIRAWLESGTFEGRAEEVTAFPAEGIAAAHVLLVGVGPASDLRAEGIRRAAGVAIRRIARRRWKGATLVVPPLRKPDARDLGQALTEGAILGGYRFDAYRTLENERHEVARLHVLPLDTRHVSALRQGVRAGRIIAESTNLARDLANEPGSVHTPEWLAAESRKLAREVGLEAKVLTPKQLEREKLGGILAVGRGAAHSPRLIALVHGKPGPRRPTLALVGKGVTFDSGGISIKPAAAMDEMKGDMSGGAAVIGALRAAALLSLPLHVVGIVGAAMNMPDGAAYVPGDIIRTGAGKTIEVLNTDAEGRIVLADALHYATRYQPRAIVDVATLTGAKIIALGSHCCAVMGSDARLIRRLREAGDRTHERAWELPVWDEHRKQIKSAIADLKNTAGREASSSTAAALLSHFVGEIPWAHLDIAGNERTRSAQPYCPRGATGFGVRLLVELLRSWR